MEPTEICCLGSCRQTGAKLSASLHVSGIPGVPLGGRGRVIALGSAIPSPVNCHRDGVSSARVLPDLQSGGRGLFHVYNCSCSWLLSRSGEVVGTEDFLLLP